MSIRVTFNDDAGHHGPVTMDEGVTDSLTEGLICCRLIDALHVGVQFERMRDILVQVSVDTVIELEKIGFPSSVRVVPVRVADTWICAEFLPEIHEEIGRRLMHGLVLTKHQNGGTGDSNFIGLWIFRSPLLRHRGLRSLIHPRGSRASMSLHVVAVPGAKTRPPPRPNKSTHFLGLHPCEHTINCLPLLAMNDK